MKKNVLGWSLVLIGLWLGIIAYLKMKSYQYRGEALSGRGLKAHDAATMFTVAALALLVIGGTVLVISWKSARSRATQSYCPNCGATLNSSHEFCSLCGQKSIIKSTVQGYLKDLLTDLRKPLKLKTGSISDLLLSRGAIQQISLILLTVTHALIAILYFVPDKGRSALFWGNFTLFGISKPYFLGNVAHVGLWFLFSCIGFILIHIAILLKPKRLYNLVLVALIMISSILHVIFFFSAELGQVGWPVLFGLVTLVLFFYMFKSTTSGVNKHLILTISLLAFLVSTLYFIRDFNQIPKLGFKGTYGYEYRFSYELYMKNLLYIAPFLLVRFSFVLVYFNLVISIIKYPNQRILPIQQTPIKDGLSHGTEMS